MDAFISPGPVPPVPGGLGNNDNQPPTKKKSPNGCISYDFVINNYSVPEKDILIKTLDENYEFHKALVSEEVGKQGTPHLQCYFKLRDKKRYTTIVNSYPGVFDRASFRATRDEKALQHYILGTGAHKGKPGNVIFQKGLPKTVKIIHELRPWQAEIEKLYLTDPDDRKVNWWWESKGNVGKSAFVKYMVVKHNALFCDGGKKSDLVNLVFNANMDDCKCIIWDLPRGTKGKVSYSTIEAVKNGMVCNTKYETGVKTFNVPHVFIFANFPPENPEELSSDRWAITEL